MVVQLNAYYPFVVGWWKRKNVREIPIQREQYRIKTLRRVDTNLSGESIGI
jgi:hypothetical protein